MFRNLRITVFIYYMLTVTVLMAILYYSISVAEVKNISLLFFTLFVLSVFAGIIISKLSIDPLFEHVTNLQNLSTETLHELNLPISTIKTNMHMLKKSLTCEKDLKRTYRIENACEMMQQRYNELDYMIKLQSSDIAYEKFELSELVQNRVTFLNRIYTHMEFELDLSPSQINNDKIGLSKVIDNLIDNAVKYSQNIHKVSIRLENNILHIQDFGCGIDDEELLRIFDNYYQSNKNMRGFGIGLSMVKRFCDANAISLSFKSKPNVGTTVTLKFKEN
ncbi:HAMP domain-containing sensor histidine kinase [Sulfurimonas sp.]|uniref:sensor histidine kinase n=1 Tax=Sulfurimonas sp. TaxID=2022749 RepID=UPI0025E46A0D|nr:HAMP domain-containing sensor histidine kinase [Sulfurimonas sp.]MCK9472398.1 HAMP domain-containing histidine kinase [Sulfurimonas sp.]MDD3506539.1 HAMP domain-containing sensor histidine kinase [Sulfurimonas sp.]